MKKLFLLKTEEMLQTLKHMNKLRNVSFGNTIVKSLLLSSMLMVLVTYVSTVSSALIAGKIVGTNALCAINLISPLSGYVSFIAGMIGIGSSLLYFRYTGANNIDKANRVFSQGLVTAIVAGVLIFIIATVGKDSYLNGLDVSEEILYEADRYWTYYRFVLAFMPLDYFLLILLYPDTRRVIFANAVLYTVGISSTILLTYKLGTLGTSIGIAIGIALSDLVLSTHFISKKNAFKFVLRFSLSDCLDVMKLSFVNSSTYLDNSLLVAFINHYVISHFSDSMLPITSIMITILDITVIFDSVGSAFAPVAEVYLGEENYKDEINLAKYSLSIAILFGIGVALFFIIFAPIFPKFFEINDIEQSKTLIKCIRLFAPSLLFFSASYMMIYHYIAIRKIKIAIIFEWLRSFIIPTICISLFGNIFGFVGVWGIFILAHFLSTIGILKVIRYFPGKEKSIWLLDENKYISLSKSYIVNAESIINARDDAERFLKQNNIDEKTTNLIMITIEDMTNLIMNHNINRKVIIQYTLSIRDDCVYLFERDNGNSYDLSNTDMDISNFNEYIFSCMLQSFDYKQYLILVDYNRNIFHYKLS